MDEITTVGLDLAKNVFQVHAIDGEGKVVIRRRLRRGEVMPRRTGQQDRADRLGAAGTRHDLRSANDIGSLLTQRVHETCKGAER